MNLSMRTRQEQLADIAGRSIDLIVVGGGIVGAGIAWDAALRGLRVVLLEKGDFGSGTSSKSSKLLHGGLRYLENFEFHLVFESLAQRNRLFEDAPHVARPLDFLFPIYRGGYDRGFMVNLGLWTYDVLAHLSHRAHATWHRRLSPDRALEAEPRLRSTGLTAAFRYRDGVTEDARLVIETIKSASRAGAAVLNYVEVTGFCKDAAGRVTGVSARDVLGDRPLTLATGKVFNAAGPWVDALLRLDDPGARRRLRPTKGVHVLTKSFVRSHAVVMRSRASGEAKPRMLYVIPWGGRTLIGTTDTDHVGDPDDFSYLDRDAEASPSEVRYLLDATNATFDVKLTEADVLSAYAGWRPLIAPPDDHVSTSAISREHEVFETASGLLAIAGGKLTAFRAMARQAVDAVIASLGTRLDGRPIGPSTIEECRLSGSEWGEGDLEMHVRAASDAAPELPAILVQILARRYGSGWSELAALLARDADLAAPLAGLADDLLYFRVEPVYAALFEGATSVADFLMRRTRLYLQDPSQGLAVAEEVAQVMGSALGGEAGWDATAVDLWVSSQVARYREGVEAARAQRRG